MQINSQPTSLKTLDDFKSDFGANGLRIITPVASQTPMHFDHIMIDCETLGTKPGCHILSLAAIGFDPVTGEMDPEPFYERVGLPADGSLRVDAGTLHWWLDQSEEARKAAFTPDDRHPCAPSMIEGFCDYVFNRSTKSTGIWSFGSTFDFPIITQEIDDIHWMDAGPSWHYRQIRDARTVLALVGLKPMHEASETAHNPLDDCRAQIRALTVAWGLLGLAPKGDGHAAASHS